MTIKTSTLVLWLVLGTSLVGCNQKSTVVATSSNAAATSTAKRPQLTATQASTYTLAKYFSDWTPETVATGTAKYTVAKDGTGTHTTVQSAINAAVALGGTTRVVIAVKPGTYREIVNVPSSAPPITLYGTGTANTAVVIVYNNGASTTKPSGGTYGTAGSATVTVSAKSFHVKNLTISNDFAETSANANQAVALNANADKQIYDTVRILGNQDTLLTNTASARQYFKNAFIEGDVDFIFGNATAVFDNSEIRYTSARRSDGVIFAPSTAASQTYGYLVINSRFTVSGSASNTVRLGRSWDTGTTLATYVNGTSPNGQTVIRDSAIGNHIMTNEPWGAAATSGRPYCSVSCTYSPNRFFEYNNTGNIIP